MVFCEYSLKEIPKGEKRIKYYFIVFGKDEHIHTDGIDAHIEKKHHEILVSKETAINIFGYCNEKKKTSGIIKKVLDK